MAKKKASIIDTKKYTYKTIRIRDKDGAMRYSSNNADSVARAMLLHVSGGGTLDQVIKANKLDVKTRGKNAGLVRMTLGVMLRGLIRDGEPVKIGKLVIKTLKQPVALPKVETIARKPAKKTKPAKKASAKRKPRSKPAETVTEAMLPA